MRKQSAMGSSKYEFEPERFGKDVKNKKEVAKQLKNNINEALYRDYKYHDGTSMSNKWKRKILSEVHLEFLEGLKSEG